ncbi:hypothetical protein CROQUDRAFT_164637 [Cronartium quercuum f. sp. fusiforme G11]|uniref:Secreted protein n=1 Tax=Cronartium quercuum f. sp. fusiforme G11 TaxID=708437 RepID=A0A9P6NGN2_9BASI|nr:hypothetical protein CROQUDRAFT_164637 [Cronartium quercuum f. sp. fusiforme G11]
MIPPPKILAILAIFIFSWVQSRPNSGLVAGVRFYCGFTLVDAYCGSIENPALCSSSIASCSDSSTVLYPTCDKPMSCQ